MERELYHGAMSNPLRITTDKCVRVSLSIFRDFASRALWIDSPNTNIAFSTFVDCHSGSGEGGALFMSLKEGYDFKLSQSCFESCSCPSFGQAFSAWNREVNFTADVAMVSMSRMRGPTQTGYTFILLGGSNAVEAINSSWNEIPIAFRLGGYTEGKPTVGSHCLVADCNCVSNEATWIGLGDIQSLYKGTTTLQNTVFTKITEVTNLLRLDNYIISIKQCIFTQCEGFLHIRRARDTGCQCLITECAFDTYSVLLTGTYHPTLEQITYNYKGSTQIPHIQSIQCNLFTRKKNKSIRVAFIKSSFVLFFSTT